MSTEQSPETSNSDFKQAAFWSVGFLLTIVLFFVSGFVSLIYQVVWTRMLVFVFGSTTFASSTVLAVFMGGLALGSFLAGRYCDRIKRPFLWYGILEGIIGVWALLAPSLFDMAIPLYKVMWAHMHLDYLPFALLRFLVAAIILLPPTTCMGATLPLLSKFISTSLSSVGNRVGLLYSINTLGAVAGSLTGGFLLLPMLGLSMATMISAGSNILLCGIVFLTDKKFAPVLGSQSAEGAQADSVAVTTKGPLPLPIVAATVAFAFSGAVAMIYEVAWTRTLLMVIGSTTYAFTVMLSTFLIGIFLGSLAMSRFVDRMKNPLAAFAILQLIICIAGIFSVYLFNFVPFWNLSINQHFGSDTQMAVFVRFFLSALVLLPITLCLGAIFPVVVKVCTRDLEAVGRSVGMLYSANTVGAICGAFLAGFCIVPMFGAEKALVYASAVNLMIAIGLLLCLPTVSRPAKAAGSLVGICAMSLMIAQPEVWDRLVLLAAQKERRILAVRKHYMADDMSYKDWHDTLASANKVLFWKDGTCANVGVLGYSWLPQRSLLTNGHVDASHFDKKNNLLLATYPLMFKPDAKDICVIGWGSGISVGVAGLLPTAHVDAIEIEPAVIEAGRFFNDVNFEPDKNPRVKLEVNDGRNYLLATDKKFDVLISEPSNPWQAGVCNLFTKEYFAICHDRVKPGGMFAAWVQMDEVEKKYVLHVLSALQSQFKYTMPIIADRGNLMVMASDEPIKLNYDLVQRMVQHSPLTPAFAMADVMSADDVLASLAATPEAVKQLTTDVSPNSDDRNKLEYEVSKTYESQIYSARNAVFFQKSGGDFWNSIDWGNRDSDQRAKLMADVGSRASALGEPLKAARWADQSFQLKGNAEALRVIGVSEIEMGHQDAGIAFLNKALTMDPNHVPTLQTRGMVAMASGQLDLARADFNKVLKSQPGNKVALLHLAQSYLPEYNRVSPPGDANKPEQALAILRALAKDKVFSDKHPDVYRLSGLAAMRVGSLKDAETSLANYVAIKGDDGDSWRALACIQYGRGNTTRAAFAWDKSLALSRIPSSDLVNKARNFLSENKQDAAISSLSRALELNPANREAILMLRTMAPTNTKASDCLARLKVI